MNAYIKNFITKFENNRKLSYKDFSAWNEGNNHWHLIDFIISNKCDSYHKQFYNYVSRASDLYDMEHLKEIRIKNLLSNISDSEPKRNEDIINNSLWYNYIIQYEQISPLEKIEFQYHNTNLMTYFSFRGDNNKIDEDTYYCLKHHPKFDINKLLCDRIFKEHLLQFKNKDLINILKENNVIFNDNDSHFIDFRFSNSDTILCFLESNLIAPNNLKIKNKLFYFLLKANYDNNIQIESIINKYQIESNPMILSAHLHVFYFNYLNNKDINIIDSAFYKEIKKNYDIFKNNLNEIIIPVISDAHGDLENKDNFFMNFLNFLESQNLCLNWESFKNDYPKFYMSDDDDISYIDYMFKDIIIDKEKNLLNKVLNSSQISLKRNRI